jgi:hypothetical protein
MASDDDFVLAGVRAGRDEHRPIAGLFANPRERRRFDGGWRHVELQVSAHRNPVGAKGVQAFRISPRLREENVDTPEHGTREKPDAMPGMEGALGHSRIHHRKRQRAAMHLAKRCRPELRLDEEDQVGPPVVEESPNRGRGIDRHELVDCTGRQSRCGYLS